MNRLLVFGYVMIGFLAGLGLGVGTGNDPTITLQRLGYFVIALVLIILWQWFESRTHNNHLNNWEFFASKGKWIFIATRYVLARGLVVSFFILLPFITRHDLTGGPSLVIALTVIIALSALAFLGHQEWTHCQGHYEVQLLRKVAQQTNQ